MIHDKRLTFNFTVRILALQTRLARRTVNLRKTLGKLTANSFVIISLIKAYAQLRP